MPRISILPQYAEDETLLLWVDTPGLNMLHVINAWEEDYCDIIVIVAPNFVSVECGLGSVKLIYSILEKIIVDVKKRKLISRHQLFSKNMELGVINRAYAGKRNRYVYAAIIDEIPKAEGVVKLDLSRITTDFAVASRMYGPGCYGGEPCFVLRDLTAGEEEDDGYLVTYMHNEKTKESWFLVMDAKTIALDIVARVKLPGRVPYGFHGLFV